AGMRAVIGLPLLDQPSAWAKDFAEYVEKGLSVAGQFRADPLLTFTLAPHAPYSVCDESAERIAQVSRDRQLKVHLHCLETAYDIEHSIRTYGMKPLQRLENLGLLNQDLIAVHMTQLGQHDIELLAERHTHVVHCPQSNLKLASGICPVAELQAAGVNVCIGTDGAASNNNLDLVEEARTAAMMAKGVSRDPTAVTAQQTVDMLTINAARALGKERDLGSIEIGKEADLCALDIEFPQTQPLYDLYSQVVYAASSQQFTDVWVAGEHVLKDRELLTLDQSEVISKAQHWRDRIRGRASWNQVAV
ncbi:MAG: amidohydrolase family protein, partial [Xanthomonadales bacterium]|nr:amidohydrolase family protein [Xanthomonadales bacterium]